MEAGRLGDDDVGAPLGEGAVLQRGQGVGHLVETLAGLGVPDATIGAIGETLAPLKSQIASGKATRAS